jgi:hypothetical protein
MDALACSIHALLACFSWSSFYVDGGLSYQDADFPHLEWVTRTNHGGNAIETVTALETVDDAYNPYGRFALGYEWRFSAVTLSAEGFYSGSFNDSGAPAVKGVAIKARWYPFRH